MDVDQSPQFAIMKRPGSVEFAHDDQHPENNATVKRRKILGESTNNQTQHQYRGPSQPSSVQVFQQRVQMQSTVASASQSNYFQRSIQQPMLPDIVCCVNPQYAAGLMHPGPGSSLSGSHYGHGSNNFNNRNQAAAPMELSSNNQYCTSPSRLVHQNNPSQSERNQVTGRSFL